VLLVAFLAPDQIFSAAGGCAAAIAVGAFIGQVWAVVASMGDQERREMIALGGLAGLFVLIGLILLSVKWR
jgi:hypothetical protein